MCEAALGSVCGESLSTKQSCVACFIGRSQELKAAGCVENQIMQICGLVASQTPAVLPNTPASTLPVAPSLPPMGGGAANAPMLPPLEGEAPPTPSREQFMEEEQENEQRFGTPAPVPNDAMLKETEALTNAANKLSEVVDELHDLPPGLESETTAHTPAAPAQNVPPPSADPPPKMTAPLAAPPAALMSSESNSLPPPKFCFDSMFDGNETDVDCGGSCEPCGIGMNCLYNKDCLSNVCETQACAAEVQTPAPAAQTPIPTPVPTSPPADDLEDDISDAYYFGFAGPLWPTPLPTSPTAYPTHPTEFPTYAPTKEPTIGPTAIPTGNPTLQPTGTPTEATPAPTGIPTKAPTIVPTGVPSVVPSSAPTLKPTLWEPPPPTAQPPTISPAIPFPENVPFKVSVA
jgi:hypothetical protein